MSDAAKHLLKALWLLFAYGLLILVGLGIEHIEQLLAEVPA